MARIGVRFMDDPGTPRELIKLAVSADRLGFGSVLFPNDTFRSFVNRSCKFSQRKSECAFCAC